MAKPMKQGSPATLPAYDDFGNHIQIPPHARTFERKQGCWNCLAGSTLVLTSLGGTRMASAWMGETVLTGDGEKPVANWLPSGLQPVMEVQTNYGGRLRMTPDHRIMTDRGWIAAVDLQPGDEVHSMPAKTLDTNQLDIDEALLLGAISGDGWTRADKYVGFGFRAGMLDTWRKRLLPHAARRFSSAETPHKKNDGTFFQIEWRNAAAREWALGVRKRRVPPEVWCATPHAIGAYLRGLFTTDGSLGGSTRPAVNFYQANKPFVEEVTFLLRMLGIASHLRVEKRDLPHHDLYAVSIGRTASLRLFSMLIGFEDERRDEALREWLIGARERGTPERISAVVDAGSEHVYDITVPGPESFFANGVLVHNCKAYDVDEVYTKRVNDCHQRDVKALLDRGYSLDAAGHRAAGTRKLLLDKRGIFGVCLKGKVEGDFVGCKHLCEDGWDARSGVIGSLTPGQPLDEPAAALYDELGEKPDGEPK